jgi:gamma-glutamyltranspeptidase/glutathione hydrolase
MQQFTEPAAPARHSRRPAVVPLLLALGLTLPVLAACQQEFGGNFLLAAPERAADAPVRAERHMIAASHPLAAEAGRSVLRRGGNALDAAIAAAMVMSLVEPQSSGIGGGGFLVHYAAKAGAIDTYDGRQTAPKSAHPYMFLDGAGKPRTAADAGEGGLPVGVPGLLRMLEMAHKEHGRLKWSELFQPAIKLAGDGFPISKRLAQEIAENKTLRRHAAAQAYFFDAAGAPKPAGTRLRNPDLADTLGVIAEKGADAFYTGEIAEAVARAVSFAGVNPVSMTAADIAAYAAKKRPPVCLPYRAWLVCGMGPPSSGGIATLQILGILQGRDLAKMGPDSAAAQHLIAEASALAFADRNVYVADPEFVPVPTAGLLDPDYLGSRAALIQPGKAGGQREPGMPGARASLRFAPDVADTGISTAHVSVIDTDGNAVALTASINRPFGSRLMVRGFLLNDELTDFSFRPNLNGAPVANRAGPGKRPRSSMAPTLVFDGRGRAVMALGSPGGARIIGYVVKTLVASFDWGMNVQAAIDLPYVLNRGDGVEIEKDTRLVKLQPALEKMGHKVTLTSGISGINAVRVVADGLEGGADRRREGQALGD